MCERCAICGGLDDDAHMSKPHVFEPVAVDLSPAIEARFRELIEIWRGWARVNYSVDLNGNALGYAKTFDRCANDLETEINRLVSEREEVDV